MKVSFNFPNTMFTSKFDEENQVWSGRGDLPLYNPEISVAQLMLNSMEIYGPKIAQVYYVFQSNRKFIIFEFLFVFTIFLNNEFPLFPV